MSWMSPCSEFERCRSWCGAGDVSYNFSKFHETLHALRSSQLSGWSFQVPPCLLTCIGHLPTCWVSYRLPTFFFPKGAACKLCVASLWVGKAVICCKICLHVRPLSFQKGMQFRSCQAHPKDPKFQQTGGKDFAMVILDEALVALICI